MLTRCIVCGASDFQQIHSQKMVPACLNAPVEKKNIGSEPVGELEIVRCRRCSHIFNRRADPEIFAHMYHEEYSSRAPDLEKCKHIIAHAITGEQCRDKILVEIGASDFSFSELLLEAGAKKVIAFEPSALFRTSNPRIMHIKEYFAADLVPKDAGTVDLIILRHVLEHVIDPLSFIREMSDALKVGSRLYIELPNGSDSLQQKRIYDFFYEHISYFSPEIVERILCLCGFRVLKFTPLVDGQQMGILCEKRKEMKKEDASALSLTIPGRESHIRGFRSYVSTFTKALAEVLNQHKSVAIYGAGSQAITVVSLMGLTSKDIRFMLDISDFKEHRYTPSSHILIRKPTEQTVNEVEAIVIIASLHQGTIHKHLRQIYKFNGKIYGTYPAVSVLR